MTKELEFTEAKQGRMDVDSHEEMDGSHLSLVVTVSGSQRSEGLGRRTGFRRSIAAESTSKSGDGHKLLGDILGLSDHFHILYTSCLINLPRRLLRRQ